MLNINLFNMKIAKYSSLGNDYLFVDSARYAKPSPKFIKNVCDRHFGIGADGVLYGGVENLSFVVKIFNSDGSEAEVSGNGLRIFAKSMFDFGFVRIGEKFCINTPFRKVWCKIWSGNDIELNMGMPIFVAHDLPNEMHEKVVEFNDIKLKFYPVSVGNPHCVIFVNDLANIDVCAYGSFVENLPCYPAKTNVQFAQIINDENIKIEIWERGSGYTLASGSSSCAVFAIARQLNLCSTNAIISMAGGSLALCENNSGEIMQRGSVFKIADCILSDEFLEL